MRENIEVQSNKIKENSESRSLNKSSVIEDMK